MFCNLLKIFIVSIFLLGLNACEHDSKHNQTTTSSLDENKFNHHTTTQKPTFDSSVNSEVTNVYDTIDNGSLTIVVTFNKPIQNKKDYSNIIQLFDQNKKKIEGAWILDDNQLELKHSFLESDTEYLVSVNKNITFVDGSHLAEDFNQKLITRKRKPSVFFAERGSIISRNSSAYLPIWAYNSNKIDLNFYQIEQADFPSVFRKISGSKLDVYTLEDINQYLKLIYTGRFDLELPKNTEGTVNIDLDKIKPIKKGGIFLAILKQAGLHEYQYPFSLISISDIGLSAHLYHTSDKLIMIAQNLSTGKMMPGVKIEGINHKKQFILLGTTNESGILEVSEYSKKNLCCILAQKDQDISFMKLNYALDLSRFETKQSNDYHAKQLFVFGARDLYRPGETVYLNALLRDGGGDLILEQPIILEIQDPQNNSIKTMVLNPVKNENGFYQLTFKLPSGATTGNWNFVFKVDTKSIFHQTIKVEDFLPERMALEIKPDSLYPLVKGEKINFAIKGWYLYGMPADGNILQGKIFVKNTNQVEKLPGFLIGDSKKVEKTPTLIDSIEKKLDSSGQTTLSVPSLEVNTSQDVYVNLSLLDAGGRPVSRVAKQTIWPASEMPVIKPLIPYELHYNSASDKFESYPTVDLSTKAIFEIGFIDNQQQAFLAKKDLKVQFVYEKSDFYWLWDDKKGWERKEEARDLILTQQMLDVSKGGTSKVSFIPEKWGRYRLDVIDLKTQAKSSVVFYAGYVWNNSDSASLLPDQVKLSLDKTNYLPGESVKVKINAPAAGAGYLLVESNDGILWQKEIMVPQEGIEVEVPLGQWHRNDLYLTATVIRENSSEKMRTSKRAVGIQHIPMNMQSKQLAFSLQVPEKTIPNQKVKVKLNLKEDSLKALENTFATVLVSVVDVGVLNITNFKTPDPFLFFYGPQSYNVGIYDLYGNIIESAAKRTAKLKFGGDRDDDFDLSVGGKKPDSKVRILSQQLMPVHFGKDGTAEVELLIPDFNGQVRVMAQAWTKNAFGHHETNMLVAAPLVMELTQPKFLANGDQTSSSLEIRNMTDLKQKINVSVDVEGPIALNKKQELVKHLSYQDIIVQPKENIVLNLDLAVKGKGEQAKINIKSDNIHLENGQTIFINRSWSIGIRPPYPARNEQIYTVLDAQKKLQIVPLEFVSELIPDSVKATLIVAPTPPLNITEYVNSLFAYPYSCLEQTISGIFPAMLITDEQIKMLGMTQYESREERIQKVNIGIDRIYSMQQKNGGFALWNIYGEEKKWLTVYATDFLFLAKEQGYYVNEYVLKKATKRISEYLYLNDRSFNFDSEEDAFAVKAYASFILARQNIYPELVKKVINNFFEVISRELEEKSFKINRPLAMVQLSIASFLIGDQKKADFFIKLAQDTKRTEQYFYLDDYGSKIRDHAMIAFLLNQYDLYPKIAMQYLLELTQFDLRGRKYLSTQENNSLFLVALNILKKQQKSFAVSIGNQDFKNHQSYLLKNYEAELGKGIHIKNNNDFLLYANLNIVGYPKHKPKPTTNNKNSELYIERKYFDIEGNPIDISQIKVGDLVIVELTLTAKQNYNNILIVDLLPAGLELENQNLNHANFDITQLPLYSLSQKYDGQLKHQEFRDDRYVAAIDLSSKKHKQIYLARAVTPGVYVVPPPYAQLMYDPEKYAIGDSLESLVIKRTKDKK